jgi:hypothetical protein
MIKLLLDCGIFIPIDVKKGVYYQLSGTYPGSITRKLTGSDIITRTRIISSRPYSNLQSNLAASNEMHTSQPGGSKIQHE